jgi:hypothetical protein
MTFIFYITDLYEGAIKGTNDEDLAKEYAKSEDFFVVNAESGMWLQPDNEVEVKEVEPISTTDED